MLMVYRETVNAGVVPSIEELSKVLGCLRLPQDSSLKARLIENLGIITETSKGSNLCSLIDGFGEYDPRAFSLFEVCYYLVSSFLVLFYYISSHFLSHFRKPLHLE